RAGHLGQRRDQPLLGVVQVLQLFYHQVVERVEGRTAAEQTHVCTPSCENASRLRPLPTCEWRPERDRPRLPVGKRCKCRAPMPKWRPCESVRAARVSERVSRHRSLTLAALTTDVSQVEDPIVTRKCDGEIQLGVEHGL